MNDTMKRIYFNENYKIYFIVDYLESREFKGYKLDCFERDLNIKENKLKDYGYKTCTMIEYYLRTNKLNNIKEV